MMLKQLLIVTILTGAVSINVFGQEEKAIKQVIIDAYLEGAHVNQDAEAMKAGFHPNFVMFVNRDEQVSHVTIDEWAGRAAKSKRENPDRPKPEIDYDFPVVSIAENTAVARIEVRRDGKHIFTDFMSLYKVDGDWKIVGKVFQSYR